MALAPVGMILSAGFGTRLAPLTEFRAKPAMELFGRPIIFYLIKMMEKAGIKDVVINLHHRPASLIKQVESFNTSARIHFLYERQILGTAGGVINAINRLGISDRKLVVMHGDILCDWDLSRIIHTDAYCELLLAKGHSVQGYVGSVGVDDRGVVTELGRFYRSDRPAKQRGFFTGIQVLSPHCLRRLQNFSGDSLVAHAYPKFLKEGMRVTGQVCRLLYEDLGSVSRIYLANRLALNDHQRFRHVDFLSGFTAVDPQEKIFVGNNVSIHQQAKVLGPSIIGNNTRVAANAIIGPNSVVGDDCVVEASARITNSVIMSRTTIQKDERVDCAIGLSGARVLVKG